MTNALNVPNAYGLSRLAVEILAANKAAKTRSMVGRLAFFTTLWYSDYFTIPVILE
jgi:hypothetical protein